ncbi:MAG: hypothetical protein RIQ89_1846 [Bacteroidota bacterium]
MDILLQLVQALNTEEVRHFKLFLQRSRDNSDRKDEKLFDEMRKKNDDFEEDRVFKKLYASSKDKNSFYRLKNRVMEEVNKSLIAQHHSYNPSNYILHMLSLQQLFLTRNKTKVALYYLKRAEQAALKASRYDLLDIIYNEYIKLSAENLIINPDEIIAKRKLNQDKWIRFKKIDELVAVVRYRLKSAQNYSAVDRPVLALLKKIVKEFDISSELQQDALLRQKMYTAVSQILIQQKDYASLEAYSDSTYQSFSRDKLFSKLNHDLKLQMLAYLANASFKNRNYKRSLAFAAELKLAMEEFQSLLHDKYLFYYFNILVINYSVTDTQRAIKVLEEMRTIKKITSVPYYEMFIYLNNAICHFDLMQYTQAVKNLSKLYVTESYKGADASFKLRINVFELILRVELADVDNFEIKWQQLNKLESTLIQSANHVREKFMLKLLPQLVDNVSGNKEKISNQVKLFIKMSNKASDNSDVINYDAWLTQKFKL